MNNIANQIFQRATIVLFVVMSMVFALISFGYASAESGDVRKEGLTISPIRTELSATPGEVTTGKVTVTNNTTTDMLVDMSAEVFGVKNPAYDYIFDPNSATTKWMRFEPQTLTLAPGKNKTISYSLNTPLGAEPGGQYIALLASSDSQGSDGALVTRKRVASLLYITVAGDVTRQGSLLSVSLPWVSTGDTTWSALIQNKGSAHFRTNYDVVVQTVWNSDVMKQSGDALILPGSIRSVTGTIPHIEVPGIYKVVYVVTLGDAPTAYETKLIVYMPIYGWIIIGLILIYSVISIVSRIKKHIGAKKKS